MTTPDPVTAPEPLLDLQRLLMGIRRRRRTWVSLGLFGLLAGALLAIVSPPAPTAVVRILVVHESEQPSDTGSIRTDIALLQTARIAAAALDALGENQRPESFLASYQAIGLTNNVLEVTVTASSEERAVARAQALADAFIADHVRRTREAADADAKAVTDQRDRVQALLTEVEAALAATPPRATGDAADRREELIARRADLSSQVNQLTQRADEAAIGAPRVAAGTQIVDAPRALDQSAFVAGALNSVIGLVLGLTVGLALAAVAAVVKDQPLLRRELASHLGASVIAQLPAPRRGPARLWQRSRAVAERRRVAATLARIVLDGPGPVSLLELGCPRAAAALALDVAEKLTVDAPVVVVDDLPGRTVHKLAGKDSPGKDAAGRDGPGKVRIEDGSSVPLLVRPGERQIGVGTVGAGVAWTDLTRLGSETMLVVRAGYASTMWLHVVARQLADSQIPVIGVVVVHPDRRDRSDGTLWDGLHTALRGRAAATAARPASPATAAKPAGPVERTDDFPTERLPAVGPTGPVNGGLVNLPGRRQPRANG